MIDRFQGSNRPALVDALRGVRFVQGKAPIAEALINAGELTQFANGVEIIKQNDGTNDVYILVAGSVSVAAHGVGIRTLNAGDHVGEMSAIHPANPRSATVTAIGTVVALKVPAAQFHEVCDTFDGTWKFIAQELSNRLFSRNDLIRPQNNKPKLFIISSVEALPVAYAVQTALQYDCLPVVWPQGTFWVTSYPLEALEKAVEESDFAVAVALFEDVVQSRDGSHQGMRDNVIFELGMFVGHLGRHRTALVHPKLQNLTLPSDLHGITPAAYIPPATADELTARIGPACTEIRNMIQKHGTRTHAS